MQGTKNKSIFIKVKEACATKTASLIFSAFVAIITLLCTEWIHRGTLMTKEFWVTRFLRHLPAYLFTILLLWCIYRGIDRLTTLPPVATLVTGLCGIVPGIVTYFKLKLRGEPFFPWDFSQVSEATGVMSQAGIEIQPSMYWSVGILVALVVVSWLFCEKRVSWKRTAIEVGGWFVATCAILGVFLSPTISKAIGITPDMWMQNRYYKNYGVVAGFLTNIQNLQVDEPDSYTQEAVSDLLQQAQSEDLAPTFAGSYKQTGDGTVQKPNIIFVMNEAFWDVSELEDYGYAFDEPVTPNLQRLRNEAAYGKAYSPSFGGGTCDVEFEALTGFSVNFLPSGCKPYQQHVTKPMLSMASWLKDSGYSTLAIHDYYAKYWSRNTAYPNLGFDEFISLEDFENPEKKRSYYWKGGLVSDAEMARRIIEEWENRDETQPIFMHAVTMQNHTSYNAANYPADELVQITEHPAGVSEQTLGALQDFATGVQQADEMLGMLTDYFSTVDEPTIIVFWGDHYNPIGSGYEVYTAGGYVQEAASDDPALHQTPLLIWSNYHNEPVELGTVAAYEISPVVLDLYNLEMPAFYQHLANQLSSYRSYTLGVTVQPDDTTTEDEMTDEQKVWANNHWLLQYDLMFGEEWANPITAQE